MQPRDATVEQILARLARVSHGVVTRAELLRAGVTPEEIKQRVRRGALLREHRAVYRVGHRAPSVEARYMAAVRACGDGALLSGRSAAFLLGVLKGAAPPPEVTTPSKRRVKGVRTRRSRGSRTDAASARLARGDEFRRYTYGDVFEDPELMLAELRALLGSAGRGEDSNPRANADRFDKPRGLA